jgi:hypothetical protein
VIWIAEKSGSFISEDDSFPEERDVCVALEMSAGISELTSITTNLILVRNGNLLSRLRIQSKFQGREQVWVLERKPQLALIVSSTLLKRLNHIFWNTFQFLSREPDTAILLIEVLLELNLDLATVSANVSLAPGL